MERTREKEKILRGKFILNAKFRTPFYSLGKTVNVDLRKLWEGRARIPSWASFKFYPSLALVSTTQAPSPHSLSLVLYFTAVSLWWSGLRTYFITLMYQEYYSPRERQWWRIWGLAQFWVECSTSTTKDKTFESGPHHRRRQEGSIHINFNFPPGPA